MHIIPCNDRLDELIHFVARLNSDAAHHIGFFGEGEADVRASLAECVIPPAEGFFLACDNDQLFGVFGVDINPEIGRAWLFGPLIEHANWQSLADELYDACAKIIPVGIHEQDLFCDVQNINIKTFAERQGFPLRSETAVLTLERENYKNPGSSETSFSVVDYVPSFFEQFETLHNFLFPNIISQRGFISNNFINILKLVYIKYEFVLKIMFILVFVLLTTGVISPFKDVKFVFER